MKLGLFETTYSGPDEGWSYVSPYNEITVGLAWDEWAKASCAEGGGHWWWLDVDTQDGTGIYLTCQYCPATINDLYPDGQDLLFADLPLLFGTTLRIEHGMVPLDAPCQSWSGPVKAWVEEEKYYSWDYGSYEYDAWVVVEAR